MIVHPERDGFALLWMKACIFLSRFLMVDIHAVKIIIDIAVSILQSQGACFSYSQILQSTDFFNITTVCDRIIRIEMHTSGDDVYNFAVEFDMKHIPGFRPFLTVKFSVQTIANLEQVRPAGFHFIIREMPVSSIICPVVITDHLLNKQRIFTGFSYEIVTIEGITSKAVFQRIFCYF